jgi:hypothetical protein
MTNRTSNFKRKKKPRYNKNSVAESKEKSLNAIEITRRKLQSISERERLSRLNTAEDMINNPIFNQRHLDKAIRDLEINKAQIELTSRGTNSHKASTWQRKSKPNKSRIS